MSETDTGRTIADLGNDAPGDTSESALYPAETPLRIGLAVAIIILAGAGAFSATLGVPFHFEDRLLISENAGVHRIATLQNTFGQGDAGPVVWFIHALNWAITPDNAASFHAVNLALHLANAILIFFICRTFIRPCEKDALPWLPMVGGLLFALHPLTTESINYVVGRSAILVTTFSLGSVLAVLHLETGSELRRRACLIGALICVSLALGSHRVAWILPLILFAADWCRNGGAALRRTPVHGLVVAATIAVAIASVYGGANTPVNPVTNTLQMEPELKPQVAIARAADLSINRRSLSTVQTAELDSVVVEFAGNAVENFEPTNVIPGIALVIVATLGGAIALWTRQLVGFGLAWYVIALVFGAVWARNGMPFSERAVYLPVAGLAIAAAGALTFVGGRQRVRLAAAACVVILLSICAIASFTRSRTWLEEQTLWELARETAAKSPVPYHRLAVLYGERGGQALDEATSFLSIGESVGAAAAQQRARDAFIKAAQFAQSAIDYGADEHPLHVLLGRSLHMAGQGDQAESVLLTVLRDDPVNRAALIELATVYETRHNASGDRNESARAADLYERAMSVSLPSATEFARYGRVLLGLGDLENAQVAYTRALQLDPSSAVGPALENLNANLQRIGAIELQAAQLGAANQNDPNALLTFAMAGVERNDFMRVLYTLASLLDSNPNFVPAWVTLGFTQARMGQADAFIERYGTAPRRFPDAETLLSRFEDPAPETSTADPATPDTPTIPPWIELAASCARFNLWEDAAKYLLHAGENSGDPRLPMLIVADLARELGNAERYGQFLVRATEVHPEEPLPWLLICDMSIQMGQGAAAANALKEAETDGASPEDLDARQLKIDELSQGGIDTHETVS